MNPVTKNTTVLNMDFVRMLIFFLKIKILSFNWFLDLDSFVYLLTVTLKCSMTVPEENNMSRDCVRHAFFFFQYSRRKHSKKHIGESLLDSSVVLILESSIQWPAQVISNPPVAYLSSHASCPDMFTNTHDIIGILCSVFPRY